MKKNRRILLSVFWAVLGVVLMIAGYAGRLDTYWSSLGTGFFVIGVMQIIRWFHYQTDDAYKEHVDTEGRDERNRFISTRAWAWAGYAYVMLAALASVGFRIAGNDALSFAASMSACLIMVLYWVCWMLLRRKY